MCRPPSAMTRCRRSRGRGAGSRDRARTRPRQRRPPRPTRVHSMQCAPPLPQSAPAADRRSARFAAMAARTASSGRVWAAAAAVAAAAFALYHATLLPGLDFGDTGSLQTVVGTSLVTARDGYPLYFAIGKLILWISGGEPAHVLNLTSALEGGIACGLATLAAAELSGSIAAGVASALLCAVSYTFWSQSIIAEVYALHLGFVA